MATESQADDRQRQPATCPQCGAEFKTTQGLSGHKRFRHGDSEWAERVDRAQAQRLETLDSFATMPGLPPSIALLVTKLRRRYSQEGQARPATDCVICGAVCKTSQGLAGHMRYRHGAGGERNNRRSAAELIRFLNSNTVPTVVSEAIWEKILRLEGFRW